jgi:hypothetical protein
MNAERLKECTISQIASFIFSDWQKINPHALPYLNAMVSLMSINNSFGADDGYSVILYFLSNAAGYRGDGARLVKAELKRRCKEYEKANKV